jgi:membrane-bound lytic murein transglycosylase D
MTMPDDPEIRFDAEPEEVYSPERKRMGPDKKKVGFLAALGAVLLAIFGGLYLMLGSGGGISKEESRLIQMKLGSLEQKVTALEKQQTALQSKLPPEGSDTALAGKIDSLAQRIEALEKKPAPAPAAAEKPKPPAKEKAAAPSAKKVHTVLKGETVYGVSKKYGLTPAELRKLNNLSEDQPLKTGQKLVVSK